MYLHEHNIIVPPFDIFALSILFMSCFFLLLWDPGADKFDVVWLHNYKEIKPSKDFEYANIANVYTLKIAEIFPEDSGTYTCEAFNDVGEAFSSCSIVVLGE